MTKLPTIMALLLALGGPPLLTIIARPILGDAPSVARSLPFDLLLWGLLAVILLVIVRVEQQPLASIGLKSPGWSTLCWALVLVLVLSFILVPGVIWLVEKAGLPGYEQGLEPLLKFPVWYRVFLGISAGVVEEVLYRGYAIERLTFLTGNSWLGGSIAVIVFSLAHFPAWGLGPILVFFVASVVTTLFYFWKRDLVALMLAHAIGDTIGLVLLLPVSTH